MNIYNLHINKQQSVEYLDDMRLNQIKNIAQILSTCVYKKVGYKSNLYKPFFNKKHSNFIKYISSSKYAVLNLLEYAELLNKEYFFRFNHNHKSYIIIKNLFNYIDLFEEKGCKNISEFNPELKYYLNKGLNIYDANKAILTRQINELNYQPIWTKRPIPNFIKENINEINKKRKK